MDELEACGATVISFSFPDLMDLSDLTYEDEEQPSKDAMYQRFRELLAQYDLEAMVYPSYTSEPIRSGYDEYGVYWDPYEQEHLTNSFVLPSCAQVPAIALPTGNHAYGSGLGIEIVADKYQEQLLLDIAYSYTQQYDHRTLPKGAPDTYAYANAGDLQTLIDAYLLAQAAANPPTEAPTQPEDPPTVAPTVFPEPTLPVIQLPTLPELPALPTLPDLTDGDILVLGLGIGLILLLLFLIIGVSRSRKKGGKYARKKKETTAQKIARR